MRSALILAVALALGHAIALASFRESPARRLALVQALACAPAIGLGILSLALFSLLFVGADARAAWFVLGLAGLAAVVLCLRSSPLKGGPDHGEPQPRGGRLAIVSGWALIGIGAAGFLFAFTRWTETRPLGTGDAIAIWNARAAFLHRSTADHPQLLALMDKSHPDYPLFLPGAIAAQYALVGETAAVSQATGLALLAGLVLAVHLGARQLAGRVGAVAATALVLSLPVLWRWAFSQCADLPLAYLVTAAATGLASQLQGDREFRFPPLLVGFLLGLIPWTKNEGTILAALMALAFGVTALLRRIPVEPATLVRLIAGAAPGVIACALFKAFWSPANEMATFLDGSIARLLELDRWEMVLQAFWCHLNPFCSLELWALFWPFLAVTLVLGRVRPTASTGFLATFCLLALAAYAGFYLITPKPPVWHLQTSLDRLLLQIAPLIAVVTIALAGGPRSRPESVDTPRRRDQRVPELVPEFVPEDVTGDAPSAACRSSAELNSS